MVAKIIIIIVTPVLKHYEKSGTHSTDFLTWELTVPLLLVCRHFFGILALGVVLYPITIIVYTVSIHVQCIQHGTFRVVVQQSDCLFVLCNLCPHGLSVWQ